MIAERYCQKEKKVLIFHFLMKSIICIYITATGELEKKLSKGIVTFSKAVDLFENNKSLFRTPVWVIGIDIDNS